MKTDLIKGKNHIVVSVKEVNEKKMKQPHGYQVREAGGEGLASSTGAEIPL